MHHKTLFPSLIVLSLIFFTSSVELTGASEDEGEIVVKLSTESRLLPLYLAHFSPKEGELSPAYVRELEKVLRFDLENNGMTDLLPTSDECEKRIWSAPFDAAHNREEWKDRQVFYLIKAKVEGKALSVRLASLTAGTLKGFQGIHLSGQIAEDRRRIHELADAIHEALFGYKGIASTRILYTIRRFNPQKEQGQRYLSEVWESDWDGQNAVQLTHDGSYCVTPCYLPPSPGRRCGSFFYVSYQTGQPKIHMAELSGGPARRLTKLRGNQLMPAVNKARSHVAFISDAGGNPDLFLQAFSPESGAQGRPFQVYAARGGVQASPTFSPDGHRVAFVSNKQGPTRIYVLDIPPPGSQLSNLRPQSITQINRENTSPSWSPDGTKIAYSSRSGGVRQIWVYDFATGKERQLTQGRGHKENPSWAPDSLHLVFNSAEPGSCELYLVNLNQPKAVKISHGTGEKRFPCWEPTSGG